MKLADTPSVDGVLDADGSDGDAEASPNTELA